MCNIHSGTVIVTTYNYKVVNEFQNRGVIEHNDCLLNQFEEFSFEDTLEVLESLKMEGNEDINILANLFLQSCQGVLCG